MKRNIHLIVRIALLVLALIIWLWVYSQPFSFGANLAIIIGGVLLLLPLVWIGRMILDRQPTPERAVWITTFVHYAVAIPLGAAIIRALMTHADWVGWRLPIPVEIGLLLCVFTGVAGFMAVVNLALKGLGAPFAIVLSKQLAVDWMYAWTRNPMVLGALAFLVSLGIWYQSALFVVWALFLFTPALLFFVKVYEERELEIRFGESYLEYRAKTPMLFPRRPKV
jgi:protein-S-isoprenylcysteine O-methyltransferase Ste14